ncbi:MAG: Gfo/Idh/MocA family oxidoreductase [Planctomycetes bacterium]|nr:Gfo/Idh/MocA family oxidoreductase [Planctomycetota bacterium]
MVAQCRRFDADWGAFARIIQGGKIGQPVLWRHAMASYGPKAAWFMDDKLGDGPLMDGAVHNQDFANLIFGDPVSVVASSIKLTNDSCVDTASAVIRYTSGSQLMLSWSWGTVAGGSLFDFVGPGGGILQGPADPAEKGLDQTKYGYYHVINRRTRKARSIRFTRKDMYVTQARHFLDCVDGKTKCLSPGTEAIKAVASAEAILKAGIKGTARTVVW